ncbi:MAG: CZB domain-containing protein [Mariprofundus sp.]|nr:CZB domain-containing protein [Mariprofundus sp.]
MLGITEAVGQGNQNMGDVNDRMRGVIEISTVASHHDCRLGKWYDTLGKEAYGSSQIFRQLEEPHEKVHSLGRRAVERYNKGDKSGAIADVEAIALLSETVVDLLDRLIAESSR